VRCRRFDVFDPHDHVTVESEGRDRTERALAVPRVVVQPPPLGLAPRRNDRQLVRDAHRLLADATHAIARGTRRRQHPGRDLFVRFAPTRPDRIAEVPPIAGIREQALAAGDPSALQVVRGLGEPVVDPHRQLHELREGGGGLLCAFQRRRREVTDVALRKELGGRLRLRPAEFGQVVARQSPVQDPVRVVDLTVAQQVDGDAHRDILPKSVLGSRS
jgi:hypothetical protein